MILGLSKPQNIVFDGNTSEVLVRRKSGNKIQGAFSAISVLNNKKRVRRTMQPDIFDLLDNVSKGAFSVFNNLKYNRDEGNNITKYSADESMSKTDKEVLSRRVRELKDIGLIRAVKKEIPEPISDKVFRFNDPRKTFIINPIMIRCSNHEEAIYLWNHCI
jgi:hypothetical protein